jgi:hypothetical protein
VRLTRNKLSLIASIMIISCMGGEVQLLVDVARGLVTGGGGAARGRFVDYLKLIKV